MAKAKKSAKSTKDKMGESAKKILSALPDAVEHMQMVQNAVHLFEEAQKHASDLREEASKEMAKLLHRVSGLKMAGKEAKKQAQINLMQLVSTWHEKKEAFPKKLTVEVDRLLNRVGLQKDTSSTSSSKAKKPAAKKATKAPVARKSTAKPASKPAAKTQSKVAPKPAASKPSAPKKAARSMGSTKTTKAATTSTMPSSEPTTV